MTSPLRKISSNSSQPFIISMAGIVAGVFGFMVATRPFLALALVIVGLSIASPLWLVLSAAIVSQRVFPGPLGQMGVELTAADLLLIVVLLRWVAGFVVNPSRLDGISRSPGAWLIAFLGWAWLSLVVTDSWHATGLALGRVSLYGVIFLVLSMSRWEPSPLFRFIAYLAALEAILALLGVTPSEGLRAHGLYGDPGVFGLLMLAGIASSVVLTGYARGIVTVLVFVGVVLSFTRGIWVAAVFGLALIFAPVITRRSARIVVVAIAILSVALLSLPTLTEALGLNPQSASLRYESWEGALDLILEQPIVGVGWAGGPSGWASGFSETQFTSRQPYNLWLNTAAATGLMGSILLAVWLWRLFLSLRVSQARSSRAGLIYLVQMTIFSMASMIIFAGSSSAIEFLIILGAGAASVRLEVTSRKAEGRQHHIPEHDFGLAEP